MKMMRTVRRISDRGPIQGCTGHAERLGMSRGGIRRIEVKSRARGRDLPTIWLSRHLWRGIPLRKAMEAREASGFICH
jgi:hypothetical protein